MQTIIANMFIKNKLIISERNDPARTGNKFGINKLRNFLYKFADCLVCQTPDAKEWFPKKVQQKTIIIPNPIMPNLPKRFTGTRKKEIITFCRIEKQKNLPMMIDAFKLLINKHPEYNLVIYGEGTEKNKLIDYIQKENLQQKVIIKPFIEDIHKKLIDATMFVNSSNYEGISNSMIEAMGIGLPTICTDCPCGGAKMMIQNNVNGILVPVKDTKAMFDAMKQIVEKPDFAETLSINATKINETLEQNKICKMWQDIL